MLTHETVEGVGAETLEFLLAFRELLVYELLADHVCDAQLRGLWSRKDASTDRVYKN